MKKIQIQFDEEVSIDWREVANPDKVLLHGLDALILATLIHNIGDMPKPEEKIELVSDFDGLDKFVEEWLNQ